MNHISKVEKTVDSEGQLTVTLAVGSLVNIFNLSQLSTVFKRTPQGRKRWAAVECVAGRGWSSPSRIEATPV